MRGRLVQASGPELRGLRIVNGFEGHDRRGGNLPPRYNAAPSQELWAIRQHPETGERTLDLLKWGLVRYCMKAKPNPPPINAKAETVAKVPMFRDAYQKAPLHPADRRILRVERRARHQGEAALCHRHGRPVPVRARGRLGELEGPATGECDGDEVMPSSAQRLGDVDELPGKILMNKKDAQTSHIGPLPGAT
jgi:hypothetical protein